MTRPLSAELVRARSKADNLMYVKKFTLCGNDIDDVKIVRQLPNIEVLSLSVNRINSLRDFAYCPKLQELYVRKNNISDLSQIQYLADLPDLRILWLCENPCADQQYYREQVICMLPNLQSLDNVRITPEERDAAERMNFNIPEPRNTAKRSESPTSRPSYQDQRQDYQEQRQSYQDQRPVGNRYSHERVGTPSNVAGYNGVSYPTQEDGNDHQQYGGEEVRRPSYGSNNSPTREHRRGTPNANARNSNTPSSLKNENVITAILTLLKDLDDSGLRVINRDVQKRLSGQY